MDYLTAISVSSVQAPTRSVPPSCLVSQRESQHDGDTDKVLENDEEQVTLLLKSKRAKKYALGGLLCIFYCGRLLWYELRTLILVLITIIC